MLAAVKLGGKYKMNELIYVLSTEWFRKNAQSLMRHHFATVIAVESRSFYQNARELTGNTKNGQNFEYCDEIFSVWQLVRELLIKKRQYPRRLKKRKRSSVF